MNAAALPDKVFRQLVSLTALAERPGTPSEGETARRIISKLEAEHNIVAADVVGARIVPPHTRWCVTCYSDLPIEKFREVRVKGRRPYYLNFCRACEVYRRDRYAAFDKIIAEEPDLFTSWFAKTFGQHIDIGPQVDFLVAKYWEGPKGRRRRT